MTTRPRNKRGEGEKLRDEVVRAAQTLLDRARDPSAVTLRAVARQAGVSAPSLYAHFADLEAIRDAVLARSFAELDAAVETAMAQAIWPDARFVAGCLAYVEFGWKHRARYRFMSSRAQFASDVQATTKRIETALRECVDARRSSSTDTRADTMLVWAGLHGMATLETHERTEPKRRSTDDRLALAEALARRTAGLAPAKR